MTQKMDGQETVSCEESFYKNLIQEETLTRTLIINGVIKEEDYMEELKKL